MISKFNQAGATLVELIVSIAILSVVTAGIISTITNATIHGTDPMIRAQATAIAQSYMEHIMSWEYSEIKNDFHDSDYENEANRKKYDKFKVVKGLNNQRIYVDVDGDGTDDDVFSGYRVMIGVTEDYDFNGTDNAIKIEVIVTHKVHEAYYSITGYRFNI